ncbi:MAG TPA: hypothetical protein VGS12_14990 [Caulobacteraceae bacterium]|nr:hypothetical protein [Caulobacteraceae bacterium]
MRTTLTLDDDVAAELEKVQRFRNASFRSVVNDALRQGLKELGRSRSKRRMQFRTRVFSVGSVHATDLDNIAEALGVAEGDDFA